MKLKIDMVQIGDFDPHKIPVLNETHNKIFFLYSKSYTYIEASISCSVSTTKCQLGPEGAVINEMEGRVVTIGRIHYCSIERLIV